MKRLLTILIAITLVANAYSQDYLISFEGSGEHARVQVNLNRAGAKWLVLAYANLSST